MLVKEALAILVNLSRLVEEKMEAPISHVQVLVNSHISITVASLYSHMIRGDFPSSPLHNREPDWEPCLDLGCVQ